MPPPFRGFVDADDIAAVLGEVTGRTVTDRRLTYEQMRDRRRARRKTRAACRLRLRPFVHASKR
ncbi:hypothetical protein [Streptomyces akebiae]|uniref:hypothetical protein n=1 Tax=Streptomyces akebiae TaxID=2865673 RepID=UPI0037D9AAEF